MKKLNFLLFLALIVPAIAQAEAGPADLLQQMVSKMKETKSLTVLVDYIHWETAFKDLAPEQKAQFKVSSAKELEVFYGKMLSDPISFMREQINEKMEEVPAEHRTAMSNQMDSMLKGMETQLNSQRERLGRADYKVGEVTTTGDRASVDLTTSVDGETRENKVDFVRIDSKWYLPSVEMVEQDSGS